MGKGEAGVWWAAATVPTLPSDAYKVNLLLVLPLSNIPAACKHFKIHLTCGCGEQSIVCVGYSRVMMMMTMLMMSYTPAHSFMFG